MENVKREHERERETCTPTFGCGVGGDGGFRQSCGGLLVGVDARCIRLLARSVGSLVLGPREPRDTEFRGNQLGVCLCFCVLCHSSGVGRMDIITQSLVSVAIHGALTEH